MLPPMESVWFIVTIRRRHALNYLASPVRSSLLGSVDLAHDAGLDVNDDAGTIYATFGTVAEV